ncbi:MAG: hypothetical protein K2M73_03145 [Lachnospiraceae bacterium]|nr:hypothetical protein [Lachnospiraceae bacterium]
MDNTNYNEKISRKDEIKKNLEGKLFTVSEYTLANKVANVTLTILVTIICIAYIMELVKGNRTLPYILATCVIAYATVITSWIVFSKNKESLLVKHINCIGFGILYAFLLFTAQNDLVFTYAIPMLIVITLFNNFKFTITVGSAVALFNVASAIIRIVTTDVSSQDIVTMEIQILLVFVTVGFFLATSYTSSKFNNMKLLKINNDKSKMADLLDSILKISNSMTGDVSNVATQITALKTSIDLTISSMSEVSAGTYESAEAIQHQLLKTEEIQENISQVKNVSNEIEKDVDKTVVAISEGQKNISNLKQLTSISETAGNNVAKALESFREYTDQMNSITDLITNVATQTSLLSLNASIEAARAGEAGRGFAVVASEISNLASQTTSATEDITSLIRNISEQLQIMIDTIYKLLDSNKEQIVTVEKTSDSFSTITDNVNIIHSQSQTLVDIVNSLAVSNKAIIDSIQTISAITEEVSAHSSETYTSGEQNQTIVNDVQALVESLNNSANELKSAQNI